MVLESVKSCSMAPTSASLGVLVRKRPVILCMRCIARWLQLRVVPCWGVGKGQLENKRYVNQMRVSSARALASGGCAVCHGVGGGGEDV